MNTVAERQKIEKEIAKAIITSALEEGYSITVNDGEEDVLDKCFNEEAILAHMFTTDENKLKLEHPKLEKQSGIVVLVYGNDGHDVIHDYSASITFVMRKATSLADKLAGF